MPGEVAYHIMNRIHPVLGRLICLMLIVALLFSAGCLDDTDTGNGQAGAPVPAGFVQYQDAEKGYALSAPPGWDIRLVGDTYLLAQDSNSPASIIIWPIYLGGKNAQATAVGLSSYTAGQLAQQYPGFAVTSLKKSTDNSIVEIAGNYTANGIPKTVVMTSMVKEGSGLFVAYDLPSSDLAVKEGTIREVVSTFTLTGTKSQTQPVTEVPLIDIRPRIHPNPHFPLFPGGMTLKIPQGWVAYQAQADTCSINWWAGNSNDLMTQTSALSQFLIFKSEKLRNEQVGYWQLYGASGQDWVTIFQNMPVDENVAPDSFLTVVLPGIGRSAYLSSYYPNLAGISDVRITATRQPDDRTKQFYKTALNADVEMYDFTFMKSGVLMKGSAIVWASDFPGMPWWNAGMYTVFAPESTYAGQEAVLIRVFQSQAVTPEWQQACRDVSAYQAEIQNQVFTARQKSQDRIFEKWDDVILDRDRLYNPDTGDVYHVDIAFPDYYKTNRENFEMQNLRELTPEEWKQIPLDGRFYIR